MEPLVPFRPILAWSTPRVTSFEKCFLTVSQVQQLTDAVEPYRLLVRVLAFTGLRWGEAAALRPRLVDLARRRIEVVEATSECEVASSSGHRRT
jgi:integrase